MKKKIMILAGSLAILASAGVGFASYQKTNSELSLLMCNIEALAGEETGSGLMCYNTITTNKSKKVLYCGSCDWESGDNSATSGTGTC